MQEIEDACCKALAKDCGHEWAQFFRQAWFRARKALQLLAQHADTSPVMSEKERELFAQQFAVPMLSGFIHLTGRDRRCLVPRHRRHALRRELRPVVWDQQQDIEAFIERILQHIDGSIYVSRAPLFTLKLARDDYDPATLLELNQTNVIRLESFKRTLPEELINQVTLSYRDRTTDKSVSISVQDIAGIERSLGEIKDAKVSYEGVANGALAARLAMRDLRQLSFTLAKITLVVNRRQPQHRRRLQILLVRAADRAVDPSSRADLDDWLRPSVRCDASADH